MWEVKSFKGEKKLGLYILTIHSNDSAWADVWEIMDSVGMSQSDSVHRFLLSIAPANLKPN